MPVTRTAFIRMLRLLGIVIVAIIIIAYATWRSLNYAKGPRIDISEPANGATINDTSITIKGRVERADHLFLNSNPLSVDEQGDFTDTLIIFPGTNIITLVAQDQFGRSTQTELDLYGTQGLPTPKTTNKNQVTTSTATSS